MPEPIQGRPQPKPALSAPRPPSAPVSTIAASQKGIAHRFEEAATVATAAGHHERAAILHTLAVVLGEARSRAMAARVRGDTVAANLLHEVREWL